MNLPDELAKLSSQIADEKSLLIRESFLIWYNLVEGFESEHLEETEFSNRFLFNVEKFQQSYYNDPDCCFIFGWMLSVGFWYFKDSLDEEDGAMLSLKAYNKNQKNNLFKWGCKQELRLSNEQTYLLVTNVIANFDCFFNHGKFIKDYFVGVMRV